MLAMARSSSDMIAAANKHRLAALATSVDAYLAKIVGTDASPEPPIDILDGNHHIGSQNIHNAQQEHPSSFNDNGAALIEQTLLGIGTRFPRVLTPGTATASRASMGRRRHG